MRGSDDTSVRVCVRPVLFRVLGTWCPATPATSVVGELLLVFLFCVLTTRDDALLASLSSRIVLWLPVGWNVLRPIRPGAVRPLERAALRQP